ncbi:heme ABC exporter ATP-binding protein CcmA [Thermaurantiacus sp.]|uniref:heme ABC exporter ATP-binding protein CcmA n=1 Tax=Thermaurantiacus sp. TaxID=2820283 RepID=UPI00298F242E|nr:heme ABC exporter ATP-binding protein CcmA [Thermaurantiacus sp.]
MRDLALVRGGRLLIEGLSLVLAPGEALIVTGPNGVGKTSLLRALAGLLAPAAGRIDNPFPTAFQGPELALKPDAPLGRELAFWARLDGQAPGRVADAARALGLEGLLDVPVGLLSAGQRQRGALVRVLASGAALWLLDEPTALLDAAACTGLEAAIRRHLDGGGLAVVATHRPLGLPARHLRLGGAGAAGDPPPSVLP